MIVAERHTAKPARNWISQLSAREAPWPPFLGFVLYPPCPALGLTLHEDDQSDQFSAFCHSMAQPSPSEPVIFPGEAESRPPPPTWSPSPASAMG